MQRWPFRHPVADLDLTGSSHLIQHSPNSTGNRCMKAKAVAFSSTFNAKSFHLIALLIGAFSAPAQTGVGIVNFGNPSTSDDRRIWTGGAGGLVRAAGTGYRVALYWGPQGTPESGLIQVGASVGFLTGTAAG